jgi:hypothetical protein
VIRASGACVLGGITATVHRRPLANHPYALVGHRTVQVTLHSTSGSWLLCAEHATRTAQPVLVQASAVGRVPLERLRQAVDEIRGDQADLTYVIGCDVAGQAVEGGAQDRSIEIS